MKLVVNRCFGGFGLSHEAFKRYFELAGWKLLVIKNDYSNNTRIELDPDNMSDSYGGIFYYKNEENEDNYFSPYEIDRSDPILIQVVEELGDKADGSCASLDIVEIPDDVNWTIKEYDGQEWVAEVHRTW
jgi:hypothetical protein